MKALKEELDAEVISEIECLAGMTPGSEEHSKAVESIAKLHKMKEEETNRNFYLKLGVDAAAVICPLMFYGIWMRKGLKFEETGTFTSITFKNFINKFRIK